MKDQEVAEAERDVFQLGMLTHAERQTKALERIYSLLLLAFVLSVVSAFVIAMAIGTS